MRERKIYDSVHGFIRFQELETALIDTAPFQRLHSIHQLGIAYLVYPGATHTRFEHSLGVMELASRLFDRIIQKKTCALPDEDFGYWREVVRLAALLHDLGHLPFSHTAEQRILGEKGHETWTAKIVRSGLFDELWERLQKLHPGRPVVSDLVKLALGESSTPWEKLVSQIITADFFGADRIDYLLRDAQCTGVSYGLFDYHQLIEMVCAVPGLELGMEENGIEACEALLLARHFMYRRVYQYPSVRSYAFHLSRFMKIQADREGWLESVESYLAVTDDEVRTALRRAARDPRDPGHLDALCLLERGARFKAIELPPGTNAALLETLRTHLGIEPQMMEWEISGKRGGELKLSFPVLTRSGEVAPASSLSKIALPHGPPSWVYIAPSHRLKVEAALI